MNGLRVWVTGRRGRRVGGFWLIIQILLQTLHRTDGMRRFKSCEGHRAFELWPLNQGSSQRRETKGACKRCASRATERDRPGQQLLRYVMITAVVVQKSIQTYYNQKIEHILYEFHVAHHSVVKRLPDIFFLFRNKPPGVKTFFSISRCRFFWDVSTFHIYRMTFCHTLKNGSCSVRLEQERLSTSIFKSYKVPCPTERSQAPVFEGLCFSQPLNREFSTPFLEGLYPATFRCIPDSTVLSKMAYSSPQLAAKFSRFLMSWILESVCWNRETGFLLALPSTYSFMCFPVNSASLFCSTSLVSLEQSTFCKGVWQIGLHWFLSTIAFFLLLFHKNQICGVNL